MNDSTPNYTEAFAELQIILKDIEEGTITIDELSEKVKRATALISICRRRLTETEEDVSKILDQMNEGNKL